MDQIVGNTLLNATRQPVLCFTERVSGLLQKKTFVLSLRIEKIGKITPHESPRAAERS